MSDAADNREIAAGGVRAVAKSYMPLPYPWMLSCCDPLQYIDRFLCDEKRRVDRMYDGPFFLVGAKGRRLREIVCFMVSPDRAHPQIIGGEKSLRSGYCSSYCCGRAGWMAPLRPHFLEARLRRLFLRSHCVEGAK